MSLKGIREYLPPWANPKVVTEVTRTRSVFQVILEEHGRLMKVGDEVFGGINVVNSGVGFNSVEVADFVHRLVCSNGMIRKVQHAGFRRIHLKGRETLTADLQIAFAAVVASIPVTLDAMQRSIEVPLGDPEKALLELPRKHGLTEEEFDAVQIAWEDEPGESLYELVNAITGAARASNLSQDSRLKLQIVAGKLLPA